MANSTNSFAPTTSIRPPVAGAVPTNFGVSVNRAAAADFLAANGNTNPPFNDRTSGRANPQAPDIRRGYIRKANITGTGGGGLLNFMYNPPTLTRQYLSYMDQAAIDPYNTLFQSGNTVAPPSMVQFTFDMIFDRQIEDAQQRNGRGALVDLDYFDLVVRNVPPNTNGSTDVPDNGVMMINPEDIVVVFGDQLSVQGRPINSQVQYSKFNEHMVPTQIQISLTLIINYFGPLRNTFGLNPSNQIDEYQALVPYPEVNVDFLPFELFQSGIQAFGDALSSNAQAADTYMNQTAAQNMASFGGGTPGSAAATLVVSNGASSTINGQAWGVADSTFGGGGTKYSQARRGQIPQYADCSSLVSYCYNSVGAGGVFGHQGQLATTASMMSFWQSSGWSTMQRLMVWSGGGGSAAQLAAAVQPGDIFWRVGHVSIAYGYDGHNIIHISASSPSSSPQVGRRSYSPSSMLKQYTHLLRPVPSGSRTAANSVRNGTLV